MTISRARQLQSLASLAALITSTLDGAEVRRRAVEAATALLDAEAGSLFLLDEATGELYFEVALGEKGDAVRQVRLRPGEGVAGWVVAHCAPLLVHDATKDTRFCRTVDEQSRFVTRNLACVPVMVQGRQLGALEAINKRQGRFSQQDLTFLGTLADQVAIALENVRLYAENSRHLQAIIDGERRHRQEKERLVTDLHDGIGGIATNIGLLAEVARRGAAPVAMADALGTVADLSRDLVAELRTFMTTLESRDLTWQDLSAEIRRHGGAMLDPHGIGFAFTAELAEPDGELGMFLYLSLFRVAKEAVANVVKHAGATAVAVSLTQGPDRCILEVVDDGTGLAGDQREGRGLRNLRRRAAELGGELTMISPPGTRLSLVVPQPYIYPPAGGKGR